jgi:DNA polymerase I-like protein with 3'-5' exonuclease and polymerase domains
MTITKKARIKIDKKKLKAKVKLPIVSVKLPYKPKKNIKQALKSRPQDTELYNVQAMRQKNPDAKKRIMFLLDHVPKEDLQSKRLLGGVTGEKLFMLFDLASTFYGSKFNESDYDWLAVNFNQFRTYGKQYSDMLEENNADFARHAKEIIVTYQPDIVVTFGQDPFIALCNQAYLKSKQNFANHLGTTIKSKVKAEERENNKVVTHEFTVVPTLSLNTLFSETNKESCYLSGYVARNLVTAFDGGKMRYAIDPVHKVVDGKFIPKYKTNYLTNVADIKKALKKLSACEYVSVDTETEDLSKVMNKVQTVQLCGDVKDTYVIPIYHMDTPFSVSELRDIVDLLRDFFERKNKNKLHITTNGKFDLNVMKANFGIRHFKADMWDIAAGEFCFDENMKVLATTIGKGYFNLGNLAMQYGCSAFIDNDFGKENRAHIAQTHLTKSVLQYCSLDVIVPFKIFFKQLERAKDIGYDKYYRTVSTVVGDQIHAFNILESTGALCDIDYLFYLKSKSSPVNEIIKDREQNILNSDEVRKASAAIAKAKGAPRKGLYGTIEFNSFDLSKEEHKQTLFFDICKLEPVSFSKKKLRNAKPMPQIDKKFQERHKDVKIVADFTALQKAQKLRNAYVNSFIKLFAVDKDFKATKRLRPTYSYQAVVTGRTSASNPNLQQLPSRDELGYHIKRLMISSPNTLLIKVDYSAHEVRCWSIISGDSVVADVFKVGAELRDRYKFVPDPWIAHRIELEGDVHKINAAYFFGLPIHEVTKPIRNAVKTVIFGLIYQQGDEGLSASTKQTVEKIRELKAQFLKRFPVGYNWFDECKEFAKENLYVESPVGRRRTLWPLMFNKIVERERNSRDKDRHLQSIVSRCLRQSVNSPVQGFGSDLMMTAIRLIDKYKYEYYLETGKYPLMNLNVSVHDSLTVEVGYEWFWLAVKFIEKAMTIGAKTVVEDRFGYEFTSTPEMDFDIGANERDVKAWNFSYASMENLVRKGLEFQREELHHKVNVDKVTDRIMNDYYDQMPEWLQKQLWANNIKIRSMPKSNPLTKTETKLAAKYRAELKENKKLLDEAIAELEALKKKSKSTESDRKTTINRAKNKIKQVA